MQKDCKNVFLRELMPIIEEKFRMGGEACIKASGTSMTPLLIHQRDEVYLGSVCTDELRKYDMILYRRDNGQYVLHRIVGFGKDGYILRGDNQYTDEYPIRSDQVLARVGRFRRNGKEYSCSDVRYLVYTRIWVHTMRARKLLQRIRGLAGAVRRKVTGG